MFRNLSTARAIFAAVPLLCNLAMAEPGRGQESQNLHKPSAEIIAVFLKPQSKDLIGEFLRKRGMINKSVDYVAMYSAAEESDSYVFRPLFGERAAFRLTGILTLEDGSSVGLGRLSNMIGEIQIDEREICLPIFDNGDISRVSDERTKRLLDAATLFGMGVPGGKDKSVWKGRIPSNKVGSAYYPAQRGQYIRIPKNNQVVVDGYMCSNRYCSQDGVCEYDRSQELENSLILAETAQNNQNINGKNAVVRVNENAKSDTLDEEKCPVCRYMKGGPCKQEFLEWDGCIKALQENQELRDCFAPTKTMMYCMKDYEYYDIMTAGTDYSKLDLASSSSGSNSSDGDQSSSKTKSNQ